MEKLQRGDAHGFGFVVGYDSVGDLWVTTDIDGFDAFCDAFDAVNGSHQGVIDYLESRNGFVDIDV